MAQGGGNGSRCYNNFIVLKKKKKVKQKERANETCYSSVRPPSSKMKFFNQNKYFLSTPLPLQRLFIMAKMEGKNPGLVLR